jgi:hypothetical protein
MPRQIETSGSGGTDTIVFFENGYFVSADRFLLALNCIKRLVPFVGTGEVGFVVMDS